VNVKVGQRRGYQSKAHQGRGKVMAVYTKKTGQWVTLWDQARHTTVTVRPSQVMK